MLQTYIRHAMKYSAAKKNHLSLYSLRYTVRKYLF